MWLIVYGKCRQIYHTFSVWDRDHSGSFPVLHDLPQSFARMGFSLAYVFKFVERHVRLFPASFVHVQLCNSPCLRKVLYECFLLVYIFIIGMGGATCPLRLDLYIRGSSYQKVSP